MRARRDGPGRTGVRRVTTVLAVALLAHAPVGAQGVDPVAGAMAPTPPATARVVDLRETGDTGTVDLHADDSLHAPRFAPTDTLAARRRVARALGLDVVVDPRLVPAVSLAGSPARGAARDVGAASYSWCRNGGAPKRAAQWGVAVVFVGGNLGLYEYFRNAWWSGERAPFFINNDWQVKFRDQDKLGHFLGGYVLAEAGRELLEGACMSEKKAALWGAAYSAAFQLQIEIWDGTQRMFGFSPPDLLFNTFGQGMSLLHAFVPVTRAILPTFSYAPTEAMRRTRAGEITSELRPTVDYSGQAYWLSIDVDTLLPRPARRWWPGLVRLSVGHTITDWVLATDGSQVRANRRWLLSLDLDPLRLPGRAPWWVATKKILRHYRFPAPALEITSSGIRGLPWHR